MQLTPEAVEDAFIATAHEQVNGEPFDWRRLAQHLNARIGERGAKDRRAIPLRSDPQR